jgi:hypothetical protein
MHALVMTPRVTGGMWGEARIGCPILSMDLVDEVVFVFKK